MYSQINYMTDSNDYIAFMFFGLETKMAKTCRLHVANESLKHSAATAMLGAMTPDVPPKAIATPCIKVCVVDPESNLCLGCHRTLMEIAGWARLSEAERARVMGELPGRRDQIRPEKLGLFRG